MKKLELSKAIANLRAEDLAHGRLIISDSSSDDYSLYTRFLGGHKVLSLDLPMESYTEPFGKRTLGETFDRLWALYEDSALKDPKDAVKRVALRMKLQDQAAAEKAEAEKMMRPCSRCKQFYTTSPHGKFLCGQCRARGWEEEVAKEATIPEHAKPATGDLVCAVRNPHLFHVLNSEGGGDAARRLCDGGLTVIVEGYFWEAALSNGVRTEAYNKYVQCLGCVARLPVFLGREPEVTETKPEEDFQKSAAFKALGWKFGGAHLYHNPKASPSMAAICGTVTFNSLRGVAPCAWHVEFSEAQISCPACRARYVEARLIEQGCEQGCNLFDVQR